MHRLLLAGLLTATVMPGCCCDQGPARLSLVDIYTDRGQLLTSVTFDGSDNELPIDGYFQAYRVGEPGRDRIRTVPLLELYDENGSEIPFERFLGSNPTGCANAEIYEASEQAVSIGARYRLVHRASASPGELEDSGPLEGDYESLVQSFDGEPALIAEIVVVEPTNLPTGAGGQGAGGQGAGGV